jgi:DNA-binding IclR family transcriptional regulator
MTQDHVSLVIRTGFHTVPICEIHATTAVRSLARRYADPVPLGATPSGVAFLASFPDDQVRRILAENEKVLRIILRTGLTRVMPSVIDARANGYAVCLNYRIPGISGIAVSIPTRGSLPYLAISNVAITSRIVGVRQKFLAEFLGSEAAELSKHLSPQEAS